MTSRSFLVWIAAIAFSLVSVNSRAYEGFSIDPSLLPTAVQPAWNSTLTFVPDTRSVPTLSSVFVVGVAKNYAYFVTNTHVVRFSCPTQGACGPGVVLAREASVPSAMVNKPLDNASTKDVYENVEVVSREYQPDLALLRVKLTKTAPKPLSIAQNCTLSAEQPVFAIGFPRTFLRTHSKAAPIQDQMTIRKRWTSGVSVGRDQFNNELVDRLVWRGTSTVDMMTGMSGGPLIDGRGDVVGVSVAYNTPAGFPFTGIDGYFARKMGSLKHHAEHIECEELKKFLAPHQARYGF